MRIQVEACQKLTTRRYIPRKLTIACKHRGCLRIFLGSTGWCVSPCHQAKCIMACTVDVCIALQGEAWHEIALPRDDHEKPHCNQTEIMTVCALADTCVILRGETRHEFMPPQDKPGEVAMQQNHGESEDQICCYHSRPQTRVFIVTIALLTRTQSHSLFVLRGRAVRWCMWHR